VLNVAVDADRAAMDHAPHTGVGRRRHQTADRGGIHRSIRLGIHPRLPINRGNVVDDVHALTGTGNGSIIAEIANRELDSGALEINAAADLTHQCADLMSTRRQVSREVTSCEPGRAGHEVTHVRRRS
jgi:3-oxoacyl-ACP reductase-like protein